LKARPQFQQKRRQEDKQTNKPKSIQSKINIKERQRTPFIIPKFQKEKKISIKQAKINKQTKPKTFKAKQSEKPFASCQVFKNQSELKTKKKKRSAKKSPKALNRT